MSQVINNHRSTVASVATVASTLSPDSVRLQTQAAHSPGKHAPALEGEADARLSRLYVATAQHHLLIDDATNAGRCLNLAFDQRLDSPAHHREIVRVLVDWLMARPPSQRGNLLWRTTDVLRQIPCGRRLINHLMGEVHHAQAFEAFEQYQPANTLRNALGAVVHSPEARKNRGLWAITARALLRPGALPRLHKPIDRPQENAIHAASKVSAALLAEVQSALGQPIVSSRLLKGGFSSDAPYLVYTNTDRYVLRVANGRDLTFLPARRLAELHHVTMPRQVASKPLRNETPAWMLQEFLQGESFQDIDVTDTARVESILVDLAGVLRRLHEIPMLGYGSLVSNDLRTQFDGVQGWLTQLLNMVELGCTRGSVPESSLPVIAQAAASLSQWCTDTPRLCHGDVSGRNVMVNGTRVVGIIDWESACGCDPAWDLANVAFTLGTLYNEASARRLTGIFLDAYQPRQAHALVARIAAHKLILAGWCLADIADRVDATDPYLVLTRTTALHFLERAAVS